MYIILIICVLVVIGVIYYYNSNTKNECPHSACDLNDSINNLPQCMLNKNKYTYGPESHKYLVTTKTTKI